MKTFGRLLLVLFLTCAFAHVCAAQDTGGAIPGGAVPGGAGSGADPDGFVITADSVEGEETPRGRVIYLRDNVTITRGGATLVGALGIYREYDRVATLFGDVHGVDGGTTIACDTLTYYQSTDVAILTGNPSYSDTTGVTTARRIEVLRREQIAHCEGDVVVVDHEGTSELTAGRLVYDFERREARAYDSPVLTTAGEGDEPDATLSADVIEIASDGETLRAFGNAVIRRGEILARARTAVLTGDSLITLEGSPVVERESDRLTGDTIHLSGTDGRISRVIALGSARTDYHIVPSSPEEEPQRGHVAGDTLTMFFQEGEPVLTTVRGRAVSEHAIGSEGEMNRVQAREIDVLFSDGEIERAVFRGDASGAYAFVSGQSAGSLREPEEGSVAPDPAPPDPGIPEFEPRMPIEEEPPPVVVSPEVVPFEESPFAESEAAQDDSVAVDVVAYAAGQIDYYVGRNRIILSGDTTVEYNTTVLTADEVIFDPDEQVLIATGAPDLRDSSERIVGNALSYDLETETGSVSHGMSTFEEGLFMGDEVIREADGTLRVRNGVFTTCSEPRPHYRISSGQMKVYLDDKVVAKPIVLYLGEIPVLPLPFFVFPIRTTRHSGFLIPRIDIGFSESTGRFVKNFGYYFAPSDYWDLTLWADFYEQTRWITNALARYKVRYKYSGSVEGSFMNEFSGGARRWDLRLRHQQEINRNWTLGATGDFRSDATYASDANQSIQDVVNRDMHSQFWARGRWSGLSVGVTLDRREDLDEGTVNSLLPKIEVAASQRPFVAAADGLAGLRGWLSKTSYSWRASGVSDRRDTPDEVVSHQGIGVGGNLKNVTRLAGRLNLTPRFDFRWNVYDRDKLGAEFPTRFTYSAGLSTGTTVYGTFFPKVGALEGIRHIIEPTASLSWVPDFEQYFDEDGSDIFYSFRGGFTSTPRERKSFGLSLVNKAQIKYESGGQVKKLDNLLRFGLTSSYDFLDEVEPWTDLLANLELRPGRPFSFRWNTRHDVYGWDLESSSLTATVNLTGRPAVLLPSEPALDQSAEMMSPADELRRQLETVSASTLLTSRPWDASLTFRYSRGSDPGNANYWTEGAVAFSLTRKWRVNYGIQYDLDDQEIASQEFTVYRDLHCWEAQFTGRYFEEEWRYYFRINVKALPEIQYERGDRYLQRRVN